METQVRCHSNAWDGAPLPSLRVLRCVCVCERERDRDRDRQEQRREKSGSEGEIREKEREREEYVRKKFIILIILTLKTVAQN